MIAVIEGRQLDVTRHAVEQYQERVRPGLELRQVERELYTVLRFASIVAERPEWQLTRSEEETDEFVVLDDAIVFPVVNGRVLTCLTRSGLGDEFREVRQQNRREKAQRKAQARKKHGKVRREQRLERDRRREGAL